MKKSLQYALVSLSFVALACEPATENIDTADDRGKAVMALDYRDFQQAAGEAIESMLASEAMKKPGGGRYVLAVSRIINDTMQHIDTDQLIKKIRVQLLNSGRVTVTTTIGGNGPEDSLPLDTRQLRGDGEIKQSTVTGTGEIIAPELSLSGKLIQRNIKVDKKTLQVEYYFQLTVTRVANGLSLWEGETVIGKRGSDKNVAW